MTNQAQSEATNASKATQFKKKADRNLTVSEAASFLSCSEETVRRMMHNGRLAGAFRLNKDWRIPVSAIDALREECQNKPPPPLIV